MLVTSNAQLAAHRAFYLYYEKDKEGNTIYPEAEFAVPSYPVIPGLTQELIDEIFRIVIHELATDDVSSFEKGNDIFSERQKRDPNKKWQRKCDCSLTHYGGHAFPHRIWGAFFAPLLGKPELAEALGATAEDRVDFLVRHLEDYIRQRGVAQGHLIFDDSSACPKVVTKRGDKYMQIDGHLRSLDYTLDVVETLDGEIIEWTDEDEIEVILLGDGKIFSRLEIDDDDGKVLDFHSIEELASRLDYDSEDDFYQSPPCYRVVQIMERKEGWVPYHGYQPASDTNKQGRIVSGYARLEGTN